MTKTISEERGKPVTSIRSYGMLLGGFALFRHFEEVDLMRRLLPAAIAAMCLLPLAAHHGTTNYETEQPKFLANV